MSLDAFLAIETANPEGPLACSHQLFGKAYFEELAKAVDTSITEAPVSPEGIAATIADPNNATVTAAIKDVVQTCLLDPTKDPDFTKALDGYIATLLGDAARSPLTKQVLAEVVQGVDVDGDGVVG